MVTKLRAVLHGMQFCHALVLFGLLLFIKTLDDIIRQFLVALEVEYNDFAVWFSLRDLSLQMLRSLVIGRYFSRLLCLVIDLYFRLII